MESLNLIKKEYENKWGKNLFMSLAKVRLIRKSTMKEVQNKLLK